MAKFSSADDIYKELVEQSDENWLYGLVAFAVIEEQRIEWAKHLAENTGNVPTDAEIKRWYEQQPPNVILRAKGTAEGALQSYTQEVALEWEEEQKKEIEQSIIYKEIQKLRAFWPQFGVNLVGGISSALIFALFLVAMAFLVVNDSSSSEVGAKIRQKFEVLENGEK